MKSSDILKKIRKNEGTLRRDFKVEAIYVFGSFARGEASAKSDVDILVDFSSTDIGMFEFLHLKEFLEQVLGRPVDLVTRDALRPWMRAEVERDAIRAA